MRFFLFLLISFLLLQLRTQAQEVITGLDINPLLQSNGAYKKSKGAVDTLDIPFIDDFSVNSVFPDAARWMDRDAFINIDYPLFPVTIGVAVLDALNDSGRVYSYATKSDPFIADHLTSHPLELSHDTSGKALAPGDSVFLSFYFQPGGGLGPAWAGYGNSPETGDSLILEFSSFPPDTLTSVPDTILVPYDTIVTPTDTAILYDTTVTPIIKSIIPHWNEVWSQAGMTLTDLYKKDSVYFKQVMIPIIDPKYFFKGFQFRFHNIASLYNDTQSGWGAGNIDQWNLDYVYLSSGRTKNDTVCRDVAFTENKGSLINTYESIPWRHFLNNPSARMNPHLALNIRNLYDADSSNVQMNFSITEVTDTSNQYKNKPQNVNLLHGKSYSVQPDISYTFQSVHPDSAAFEINTSIDVNPDRILTNNISSYKQIFYNYYAYDDGVPENGYGMKGTKVMAAMRFTNYLTDTLRAVQIFFNHTYHQESAKPFNLVIWNDAGGKPGNAILTLKSLPPIFEDSLNKFHTYLIDTNILINAGDFYIGWEQVTDVFLNIGYDRNHNEQQNLFINMGTTWSNSLYEGTLMIRPVFGQELPLGVEEYQKKNSSDEFIIYPNPAREKLEILNSKLENQNSNLKIQIINSLGQILFSQQLIANSQPLTLDVSDIPAGIYFLTISDLSGMKQSSRLIITK